MDAVQKVYNRKKLWYNNHTYTQTKAAAIRTAFDRTVYTRLPDTELPAETAAFK